MNNPASKRALHPALAQHLDLAVKEALSLYERLYPDHNLRIILYEGRDPTWAAPEVIHGPLTFGPNRLGPDFIGQVCRKADQPGGTEITVSVFVPPRATPAELRQMDAPWRPHRLQWLFALKPLLYEQVRHAAEMHRKRKASRRHANTSMPRGEGLPVAFTSRARNATPNPRAAALIGFHWLEVGGAEKLAFDTVNWALAAGLRVFVVVSTRTLQRLANRLPDHPDVIFLRPDVYLPDQLWPQFISRLIETENIQLLHIHHCQKLYDCLPQVKACHPEVKILDSTHIVEYSDGGYPRISGVWSNYIDIHHVISRDLARYFRDTFQVLGKVRLGRMLTRPMRGEPKILPPLNLSAGQKNLHVSFVGRLYYQKRPVVVVETLRALAKWAGAAGVKLSGSFVGEGPFERAVQTLLKRYKLADQIEMLPASADVAKLLARSDILLLPSSNEGLALVCYEAVENGCIPISTDVGAQKEIVPSELLVPLAPFAAVKQTVCIVDRLWRSQDVIRKQETALHAAWRCLENDPTAEELLMPIYRAALEAGAKAQE